MCDTNVKITFEINKIHAIYTETSVDSNSWIQLESIAKNIDDNKLNEVYWDK